MKFGTTVATLHYAIPLLCVWTNTWNKWQTQVCSICHRTRGLWRHRPDIIFSISTFKVLWHRIRRARRAIPLRDASGVKVPSVTAVSVSGGFTFTDIRIFLECAYWKKYPYIHRYFVVSFPRFNGTAVPYTFVSVNRRTDKRKTRHRISVDIRIFLQCIVHISRLIPSHLKYRTELNWVCSLKFIFKERTLCRSIRDDMRDTSALLQCNTGCVFYYVRPL